MVKLFWYRFRQSVLFDPRCGDVHRESPWGTGVNFRKTSFDTLDQCFTTFFGSQYPVGLKQN